MSNELHWRHNSTGETLYATIRSVGRAYWNGSALEAFAVANWASYAVALAESPAGGYLYVGGWPAGLTTVGWYWLDVFARAGETAAIGDALVATIAAYWNGTTFEPWSAKASAGEADERNAIAAAVLRRDVSEILTGAALYSLATLVMGALDSVVSTGGEWTIRDGAGNTLYTLAVDRAPGAAPIVGVSQPT